MSNPVLVVSCEADSEEWKRTPGWEKRLRRQLRRAFGRNLPLVFLPPGVWLEFYHTPDESNPEQGTKADPEPDPDDEDDTHVDAR